MDDTAAADTATRTRVFLDIAPFGDDAGGRLDLELYSDIVPATAQNFKQLCTGELGMGSSGKALHYRGAARPVRRVQTNCALWCGVLVRNAQRFDEQVWCT